MLSQRLRLDDLHARLDLRRPALLEEIQYSCDVLKQVQLEA
jgi:hypothetical protein